MTTLQVGDFTITATNQQELKGLVGEIFKEHIYYLDTNNPTPYIIDIGAHVGIASLYFKKIYPNSRILAIEPLPQNYQLLQSNLEINNCTNSTTLQRAISISKGTAQLYYDASEDNWFSTAGFIKGAWNGNQTSDSITVETITLKELLTEPIDLVKMDIEGMEEAVLLNCHKELRFIKHLIFEYHPIDKSAKDRIIRHLAQYKLKLIDDTHYTQVGKKKLWLLEFSNEQY